MKVGGPREELQQKNQAPHPQLTAGKRRAPRRGGCVWVGEGETAQETAASVFLSLQEPERTPGLCRTEQLKGSFYRASEGSPQEIFFARVEEN